MNAQAEQNEELRDLACLKVENYAEESWSFDFGGKAGLTVQCPWRIVNKGGIVVSGKDHGHKFGLKEPVDVSRLALDMLSKRRVEMVVITHTTADLVVYFTDKVELQLFNDSAGFEGWGIGTKSGLNVIGMGGGNIAFTRTS